MVVARQRREGSGKFGDYTLIQALTAGGVGEVHIAQREGATTLCVLKRLHVHLQNEQLVKRRFLREAEVASKLMHPNIAQIIDAGFEGETFYLAAEFIPGQELAQVVHRLRQTEGQLPWTLAANIGQQALAGLAYAHTLLDEGGAPLNIVHRDLSFRNLMVDYLGRVKLIDFGLVKITAKDQLTASGVLIGTPRYMSPEQAVGEAVDQRSDVYSMGVILYELFSGRPVVQGETTLDVLRSVVQYEPPPLSKIMPQLPEGISDVVQKAISKDAAERYTSAAELGEAFSGVIGPSDEQANLRALMNQLFDREITQAARLTAPTVVGMDPTDPAMSADALTSTASLQPAAPAQRALTKRDLYLAALIGGLIVSAGFWIFSGKQAEHTAPPPKAAPPKVAPQKVEPVPKITPRVAPRPVRKPAPKPAPAIKPSLKPKVRTKVQLKPAKPEKPAPLDIEGVIDRIAQGQATHLEIKAVCDHLRARLAGSEKTRAWVALRSACEANIKPAENLRKVLSALKAKR